MTEQSLAQVVGQIVDLLTPRSSEERGRIVRAALTLLGETGTAPGLLDGGGNGTQDESEEGSAEFSFTGKAKAWRKQNALTGEQVAQVFHANGDAVDVIAAEMPGKNKKEKTLSAYVLCGIAQLLATGEPDFTDAAARALCTAAGCYDPGNHSSTLKDRGNWFTGTKDAGWKLTAPGMKHGASLIKGLAAAGE